MNLSIVVCGWHFKNESLYRLLMDEVENHNSSCRQKVTAHFFVASHRPSRFISPALERSLTEMGWKILFFDNEGWDWGAYQQFIRWHKEAATPSDYYLLMHDDVIVKELGFLAAFFDQVGRGAHVVGNGTAVQKRHRVRHDYPEDVLWAAERGFPIRSSEWHVVRGSCLLVTRAVAETVVAEMPVKQGKNILLANSSLRVFGGLVADAFGGDAVRYLGDSPQTSRFIDEEYRGQQGCEATRGGGQVAQRLPGVEMVKNLFRGRRKPPVPFGSGLKLNFAENAGCLPGYLNVGPTNASCEWRKDLLEIDLPADSVAEVRLADNVASIAERQLPEVLKKVHAWLKSEGQLVVEFVGVPSSHGVHEARSHRNQGQRWRHAKVVMLPLLKAAGFREISVEPGSAFCRRWPKRIVAVK